MKFFNDAQTSSSSTPSAETTSGQNTHSGSDTGISSYMSSLSSMLGFGGDQTTRGTSQTTSGTSQTRTPSHNADWDQLKTQSSPLMIAAALHAVPAYLASQTKEESTSLKTRDWQFRQGLSQDTIDILNDWIQDDDDEKRDFIDIVLDETSNYQKYGNSYTKILSVTVANSLDRIVQETSSWDLPLNTKSLESASVPRNTLYTAIRLKLEAGRWGDYGIKASQVSPSEYGGMSIPVESQILQINQGDFTKAFTDTLGNRVFEYHINSPSETSTQPTIKVRLTDLSESQPISLDTLVLAHSSKKGWTSKSPTAVQIPSLKIPIVNQTVDDLLGAENNGWKFVHSQTGGHLTINSQNALFLDAKTVVLATYRGGPSYADKADNYWKFYQNRDGQCQFRLLVEVYLDDHLCFSSFADSSHMVGSASTD